MFISLDEIHEEVTIVRKIVTGNGNPEGGMVVKQVRMDERQKAMSGDIAEIKDILVDHIKRVENRKSGKNKLFNLIPIKILETGWMWVVRLTIVIVISILSWAGVDAESLKEFLK